MAQENDDASAETTNSTHPRAPRWKPFKHRILLTLIVILATAAAGMYAGYQMKAAADAKEALPTHENVITAQAVFEQIQAQNTLVCASQQYDICKKMEDSNRDLLNLFDLPFTTNKYWLRYVGTIQVGVDLSTATFESENIDADTGKPSNVVIQLDAPTITSNTPDMDRTEIIDQENNIFNPIDPASVVDLEKQCVDLSNQSALDGGIVDQAKAFAQQSMKTMLSAAMGSDVDVTIDWRS